MGWKNLFIIVSRLKFMSLNSLSTDNTNIVSVQLNLFDSFDEKPVFNKVLNQKIRLYTDLDLENGVVLTSPNHF